MSDPITIVLTISIIYSLVSFLHPFESRFSHDSELPLVTSLARLEDDEYSSFVVENDGIIPITFTS